MRRCLCCHWAGIVALIAIVSPLLMCRRLCSPGIFAIFAILLLHLPQRCCCCLQAGVIALVTMASSPSSMHRRLCHCHNCNITLFLYWLHCHHCTGVVLLLHQCCCPYCTDFFALTLHGHKHPHCTGVISPCWPGVFALLHWCCCPCHAGVVALGVLALSPSSYRPLCPCCACIVQLICRFLCPHWAGMY